MNVLLILADQHHASWMGHEGHPQALTPNLDRLAKEGLRFSAAYCQNPICTPSRMSILSGQYAHNHGYYGLSGPTPHALPHLFSHFKAHGYRTAGIGKLHLPDSPRNWVADSLDYFGECYRTVDGIPGDSVYFEYLRKLGLEHLEDSRTYPGLGHDSRPSLLPFEHQVESWCVDRAIEFIQQSGATPFFMEVSLPRPHHMLTPDQRFWDLYPDDLDLPPGLNRPPSSRPPHFKRAYDRYHNNEWPLEPTDFESGARRAWKGTLACLTQVDHAVGRLLEFLDQSGKASNTIIIYTADHGAYHGTFGIEEKAPGICSEAVCRVPFLWRVPGLTPSGEISNTLVESVDLASTLPGLCGISPMNTCDGKDLRTTLSGSAIPLRSCAITENVWSKSVRWKHWRLVHYPQGMFNEGDFVELYDLQSDPLESVNLALQPGHQDVVDEGRRLLLDWLIQTTRPITLHGVPGSESQKGVHVHPLAADGHVAPEANAHIAARHQSLNYL